MKRPGIICLLPLRELRVDYWHEQHPRWPTRERDIMRQLASSGGALSLIELAQQLKLPYSLCTSLAGNLLDIHCLEYVQTETADATVRLSDRGRILATVDAGLPRGPRMRASKAIWQNILTGEYLDRRPTTIQGLDRHGSQFAPLIRDPSGGHCPLLDENGEPGLNPPDDDFGVMLGQLAAVTGSRLPHQPEGIEAIEVSKEGSHWQLLEIELSADLDTLATTDLPDPSLAEELRQDARTELLRRFVLLPAADHERLVVDLADHEPAQEHHARSVATWTEAGCPLVSPQQCEVLLGNHAHSTKLQQAIQEAHSRVLVLSAFQSSGDIEALKQLARPRPDLRLDCIWGGYSNSDEAVDPALPRTTAETHIKLLLFDRPGGGWELVLGSFNWLSTFRRGLSKQGDYKLANLSLASSDPHFVHSIWRQAEALLPAELALHYADLNETLTEAEPDSDPGVVLRDDAIRQAYYDVARVATSRVGICSHRTGIRAGMRVSALPAGPDAPRVLVAVGTELDDIKEDRLNRERVNTEVSDRGGIVRGRDYMHSKLVIADNWVLIASFNFLSADPFNTNKRGKGREIGILLDSEALANRLWTLLEKSSTEDWKELSALSEFQPGTANSS